MRKMVITFCVASVWISNGTTAGPGAGASVARRTDALAVPRLPRDNLLVYRGENRQQAARTHLADWHSGGPGLPRMQARVGKLPGNEKRCPLDVRRTKKLTAAAMCAG